MNITLILASLLALHLDFNTVQMKKEAVVDCLRMASKAGYTAVLWEIENKVRWETCPECVHPEAFSKDEFREILAEADRLGLEPIPLMQTFGHAEYVLQQPKYVAWREDPACRACYCVSKPEVKAFQKALLHEYVELFGSRLRRFHFGGDEAIVFGTCPTCRKANKMDLYVSHLKDVAQELVERGVRPGVWADMVLMGGNWQNRDRGDATLAETAKLPRSFTLWNWDYNYGAPSRDGGNAGRTDQLCRLGYEVILCASSQSYRDGPFLPQYGQHSANVAACADLARRKNLTGLCVTSWSVHLYPKAVQYPLWDFAARRFRAPSSDAATDFAASVESLWGAVGLDLLDRLSRWNTRYAAFDSRIMQYEKPALPAPPGALAKVLANLDRRKSRAALRESVAKDRARIAAALEELKRRPDLQGGLRLVAEGAALEVAFLDRVTAALDGAPVAPCPDRETTAYYGAHQSPKSAANAVNMLWSVLRPATAPAAALPAWRGKEMSAWTRGSHQIGNVKFADGAVSGEATGRDPFWTIGHKPFKTTPTQEVTFRAKSPVGGTGELYWTPQDAPRPTAATGVAFEWIGDGRWHDYRVRPFWHGGADVKAIRIDFPNTAQGCGEIALADVRVVDEQRPAPMPIGTGSGVSFVCTTTTRGKGVFSWASDTAPGVRKETFVLAADGLPHRYFLTLAGKPGWSGNLAWSSLTRAKTSEALEASDFRIEPEDAVAASDLAVCGVTWATPACRVGAEGRIEAVVKNLGGEPAEAVALRVVTAPKGLACAPEAAKSVGGGNAEMLAVAVRTAGPLEGAVKLEIVQGARVVATKEVAVKVLPSLGLPKADGVPEPRPPACDYEIGALYYPGWERAEAWKRVWQTCPERRPYLGWYDETKSEVVDWQIKWLRENGIGTLYLDWYWNRGYRHHEHWIAAFRKAKWRSYLKWAVMWANHTPAGAHSVEDQRAVTQFWIDNYFNMPEYLTRDGKPVVWIWQARNMNRDLGPGGCRRLLELSREMAVKAGYKGIHFIAMKWPEDDCTAQVAEGYREMGFDETGIYHFMGHGGKAGRARRYPYALVADANPDHWRRQLAAKGLPFLPNLSTGWDDRPWNDHLEICGKNAADFRRICREAKRFADESGIRRLCLSPLNEWGEGSYAEPNAEHGFGFYEAVRETFCKKPAEGWPQNMVPADVGLGPYDLPLPQPPPKVTRWDFTDARAHGWRAFMGCSGCRETSEGFAFDTTTRDPAMSVAHAVLLAREFKTVTVRMRLENAKGRAVVFWARSPGEMTGGACVCRPVVSDGKFHDYVFRVADHARWRGAIGALRLDPCENPGARVTVAGVWLD